MILTKSKIYELKLIDFNVPDFFKDRFACIDVVFYTLRNNYRKIIAYNIVHLRMEESANWNTIVLEAHQNLDLLITLCERIKKSGDTLMTNDIAQLPIKENNSKALDYLLSVGMINHYYNMVQAVWEKPYRVAIFEYFYILRRDSIEDWYFDIEERVENLLELDEEYESYKREIKISFS